VNILLTFKNVQLLVDLVVEKIFLQLINSFMNKMIVIISLSLAPDYVIGKEKGINYKII